MISWCWAVWFFSTIMVMIGSSWFHVLHPHLSCRLIRSISSGSSFKISLKWPHFTSPASLWHHRSAKASASPSLPIYSPLSCTLLNITVSCQLPPCLADFPITPPLYTCPLHNKVGLTASTAPWPQPELNHDRRRASHRTQDTLLYRSSPLCHRVRQLG